MPSTSTRVKTLKLRNINGTSGNTCSCGSWLEHWKNFSGQPPPIFCPAERCIEKPEVGAHVQKDNSPDDGWYIVPLCKTHSAETDESLTISDSVNLVSANVGRTCEKER
jgi:hypothetical protein